MSDKPEWVRKLDPLSARKIENMTQTHRGRHAALLAVADGIERIKQALRDKGELNDTYIIFTSDNGYHLGEHRLQGGKRTAYQPDVRVPLAVIGPGVGAGERHHITLNTDLAPTVADLAGAASPYELDGRSFAPLLGSQRLSGSAWRQRFMVENWSTAAREGTLVPPTHKAVKTNRYIYNRYRNGEKEYYNLEKDAHELSNRARQLGGDEKQRLNAFWQALQECKGVECRAAEG